MRRHRLSRTGLSAPEAVTILAVLALGVGVGLMLLGRELEEVAPLAERVPADVPDMIARDLRPGNPASDVFNQELSGHIVAAEASERELRRRKALRKLEALGGVAAIEGNDIESNGSQPDDFDPNAPTTESADVSPDAVRELLGIDTPTTHTSAPQRPATANRRPATSPRRVPKSSRGEVLTPTKKTPGSPAEEQAGQRTLEYWNSLNEVIATEEGLRQPPAGGVNAGNAKEFLSRRSEAGRYAASEIRGLATLTIDPQVVKLAGQLATWYETGVELNEEASGLLSHGSDAARRGQPGQRWSQAEKSHQQSVQQLNARAASVRDAMTRKYGLRFPPLR